MQEVTPASSMRNRIPRALRVLPMCAMLGTGAAVAQSPGGIDDSSAKTSAASIEEITVSARRREENILEVPVAVSALDANELERRNYNRTEDLQTTVPSLSITTPFGEAGPLSVQVRLRGLDGVTTYFSEVPSYLFGNSVFVDLESVQVARGPQGTLFGKNAIGGAILFQPKRPEDKFGGSLKVGAGNYGHRLGELMVNVPIVEGTLAARINMVGEENDGYTRVVDRGYRLDDKNHHYERLSLAWTPTDTFSNYLVVDNYHASPNGPSNIMEEVNPDGFVFRVFGQAALDMLERQRNLPSRSTQGGIDHPTLRTEATRAINTMQWDIRDNLRLKNISSYGVVKARTRIDLDGTDLPLVQEMTPLDGWATNQRNYTSEIQLSGLAYSDRLNWVSGVFYSRDEPNGAVRDRVVSFGSGATAGTQEEKTNIGVYLQGTYQVTDTLNFTAGARYNWDKTTVISSRFNDAGSCLLTGLAPGVPCEKTEKGDWTAIGWTVGVDYTGLDNHLFYLRSAKAYNEGTFNVNSPAPEFFNVDPEYFTDIEFGHKTSWSLGSVRGQSTFAVYYGMFDDVQHGVNLAFEDSTGQRRLSGFTSNAAEATVYGAEYGAVVALTDSLRLSANISYNIAEFDDFLTVDLAGAPVDYSGKSFTFFPEWKYDLSVTYEILSTPTFGDLLFSADYFWSDKASISVDIIPSPTAIRASYDILNLRLSWNEMLGSKFNSSVYVSNATDEVYRVGSIDVWTSAGFIAQAYAPPRMWGVEFSYKF